MNTRLTEAYPVRQQQLPGQAPWMQALRQSAWLKFSELGLPSKRDEAWRYVSLRALKEHQFSQANRGKSTQVSLDMQPQVIYHNGQLSEVKLDSLQKGWFTPLSTILESPVPTDWLELDPHWHSQAMLAMNTALMQDGYVLTIPENTCVKDPINLLSTHDQANLDSHLRHRIHVKAHAEITVIEYAQGLSDHTYLHHHVTQCVLEPHAKLKHIKIIDESHASYHLAHTEVQQSEHSHYQRFVLALGSQMTRDELHIRLQGERACCELDGLFLVGDKHQVANHINIDHAKPHCQSRQHYRGIAWGQGQGVFDGKIHVAPGAHHSEAKQLNKNIVLSNQSGIFSKPQLAIHNDDVVCQHGATVGQLDEEALFYLQSRGISRSQAYTLLLQGFANSVFAALPSEDITHVIAGHVDDRLQQIINDIGLMGAS